jgi:hypothetical protein
MISRGGHPVIGFGVTPSTGARRCACAGTGREPARPDSDRTLGVGQPGIVAPLVAAAPSPLFVALAGGAATAATGWLLERAWEAMRWHRRRR